MAGIVAVFDFDKTIVDYDSDYWVADRLGFTDRLDHLLRTLPLNAAMDELMGEIHSSGVDIERIAEVLRRLPMHPRVVPAIKVAHALGRQVSVSGDDNNTKKKRFIYSGDGSGDYCPTLKLGDSDFVMPGKDSPLWDLMLKTPSLIKAEVHEWSDGQDQEIALLGIIRRIIDEDEGRKSTSTPSVAAESVVIVRRSCLVNQ